jgi:hypothetical protein
MTLVSSSPPAARLILDADDPVAADNLRATGAVAVTGADVTTLRSIQFKGETVGMDVATDADRERAHGYTEEFFAAVHAIDHTPMEQLESLRPRDYVVCTVRVVDVYDQTPGPGAGTPLTGDGR